MSDFRPDQLAERRAKAANDCRVWTPRDALLAALRDIDSGAIAPTKISIIFQEPGEDGTVNYGWLAAGVTTLEHVGLLRMASIRVEQQ